MKKIVSAILGASMLASVCGGLAVPASAKSAPTYTQTARIMEKLDRGLFAADTGNGVYLSWRFLGDEDETAIYNVFKQGNRTPLKTTAEGEATCFTDTNGSASDKYAVVTEDVGYDDIADTEWVTPWTGYFERNQDGFSNKAGYLDIKFDAPSGGTVQNQWYSYKDSNDKTVWARKNIDYTYTANDMSVGDLDGDGEYELIVKWDPTNAQDNSMSSLTSDVYIDAYEINEVGQDGKNKRLWRVNLGPNIRAGAHYTQFLVYDFDGDGKSEMMCKTAPGSTDGSGNYVNSVGTTDEIKGGDNSASYRNDSGHILEGPEYLTVFNGETGNAMQTVNYDPPRGIKPQNGNESIGWGDNYGNRSERYLAAVAYINGTTPTALFCRGYYTYAYVAAYDWDGTNLTEQWISKNESGKSWVEDGKGNTLRESETGYSLYGQGAHSVSVADVDSDEKDELIFGSAVLDDDGTVLYSDGRGHGDAEHVSDFDNDGKQEIFMVHEAGKGNSNTIEYAVDIKRYNGSVMDDVMKLAAVGDIGRGVIDNIDDSYSSEHSESRAAFWSSADKQQLFSEAGTVIGKMPNSNNNTFQNFFVYWDGMLDRELLDDNKMAKHTIATNQTSRIYFGSNGYIPGISSNNSTKATPGLVADVLGDWREEMIFRLEDGTGARIYASCIPTEYRLTTLMHDSQYRCAVAWQNVGYNQPPHTSYYIGSASLADGKKYLAPAVPFTKVNYPEDSVEKIESITLNETSARVEVGGTITLEASYTPQNAVGNIVWSSDDDDVATVENGTVKGISEGTAKITAASEDDPEIKAECQVEVYVNRQDDEDKFEITAAADANKVTVTHSITSGTDKGGATLITALYDANNTLIAVKSQNVTLAQGDVTAQNAVFENVTDAANCKAKAFLWNSAQGMKPLMSAASAQ